MVKDINLTSTEWCDIIFEGKNKKYGAYYLRKTSSKRHLKALMIVVITIIVAVLLMVFGAKLKEAFSKSSEDESITEAVKMTVVDLETPKPEQQIVQEPTPPPPALKAAIKFTAPVIDKNAPEEEDMKTQEEVTKSDAIVFSKNIEGSDDPNAVDPNTLDKVVEVTAEQVVQTPFTVAEVMPGYPGGEKELMKFLNENIKYPAVDQENGTQGLAVLRFVVGADGSISDIKVMRSISPTCDAEAIRVVKLMKKWIPGRQNGKPVPVFYQLPVRFRLEN